MIGEAERAADGLMTVAEWAALPEDDPGELVDGVVVEEEVPDAIHEILVSWLIGALRAWIAARGGLVFGSELKYAVSSRRGRKPDVSLYLPSTAPNRRGAVRVPPHLAIEVVSPTPRDARRDRIEKLAEYATFGIRYYWLLDPQERVLEIYELHPEGRSVRALGAADGLVDAVPGCEGLALDLDAMWNELTKLGPEE